MVMGTDYDGMDNKLVANKITVVSIVSIIEIVKC